MPGEHKKHTWDALMKVSPLDKDTSAIQFEDTSRAFVPELVLDPKLPA